MPSLSRIDQEGLVQVCKALQQAKMARCLGKVRSKMDDNILEGRED